VVHEGTQIFGYDGNQAFGANRTFQYEVAAACSGIRSLIALVALTTIYGFMTFESNWKRALMMAVAIPLAVLNNLIRITGVIVIAEAFGEEAGLEFHDWAGFFTFAVALGCVMAVGYFLQERTQTSEPYLRGEAV
jgi:exosortase